MSAIPLSDDPAEDRDLLAQAMWDARGILGFDNDGDKTPGAAIAGMGYEWFAREHVREAKEQRKDYEDLLDLWDGTERKDWVARAECAESALRQVRAIHRPSRDAPGPEFTPYCEGCWDAGGRDGAPTYPCPTIQTILDSAQVGAADTQPEGAS